MPVRSALELAAHIPDEWADLMRGGMTAPELVCLRYFDAPLAEVGRILGVSHHRVRQIRTKAVRKMRHPSRREFLSLLIP